MPGVVTALTDAKVSGFALHPYLQDYPVVVHVVYQSRILCSAIADQPAPAGADEKYDSWFHMSLAGFELSDTELPRLVLLIGETDELLDLSRVFPRPVESAAGVEDLIYANPRREWVTGATYFDCVHAGMKDADIVDLLYRDLLGRPADPGGLANYLFQLREGIRSLADVRKSLLDSEEYNIRPKEARWAPGAIFSQPITMLLVTAHPTQDDNLERKAETPKGNDRVTDEASIGWPSYPEHYVPVAPPRLVAQTLEVEVPVDSVLFGSGWHNVEDLDGTPFRWMETTGIIFSPKPKVPCIRIALNLAAVYGAHMPMVDCYLDDVLADTRIEEFGRGFSVVISATAPQPTPFTSLRIESRVSGCPVQEDRGKDQRILSLNVLGALIAYKSEGLEPDGTQQSEEGPC